MTTLFALPTQKDRKNENIKAELERFLEAINDDEAVAFTAMVHYKNNTYTLFGNKTNSSDINKHEMAGQLLEMAIERVA